MLRYIESGIAIKPAQVINVPKGIVFSLSKLTVSKGEAVGRSVNTEKAKNNVIKKMSFSIFQCNSVAIIKYDPFTNNKI